MYSGEYETFLLDCTRSTRNTRKGHAASVALLRRERLRRGHAASVALLRRERLRRGYAASVTLVPRERLRYHVASLLAMTCRGLFRHADFLIIVRLSGFILLYFGLHKLTPKCRKALKILTFFGFG